VTINKLTHLSLFIQTSMSVHMTTTWRHPVIRVDRTRLVSILSDHTFVSVIKDIIWRMVVYCSELSALVRTTLQSIHFSC